MIKKIANTFKGMIIEYNDRYFVAYEEYIGYDACMISEISKEYKDEIIKIDKILDKARKELLRSVKDNTITHDEYETIEKFFYKTNRGDNNEK